MPIDTQLELLHILANQTLVGTLVAKQLTCYACTIEEDLAHSTHEWSLHICHAHRVWEAIQSQEAVQDHSVCPSPLGSDGS